MRVPRTQHADFGAIAGSGTMTVTRVADRAGISSVTGMAVLAGSGTMTQIPFVIPSYPARRIGVSITPAGDVNVMVGAEISIDHGFLDIHFR
jgi:hypothetical protein